MEIIRQDEENVVMRDIDAFAASLLRQIPHEADPGNSEPARERLFTAPMEKKGDAFNEEWKEYVEPELRHLFESATETVARDLKMLKETKPQVSEHGQEATYSLGIPMKHVEQWLNALNQARLVLAARQNFTEEELSNGFPPIINTERDMYLLQIGFYGSIQEILVRELSRQEGIS